MNPSTAHYRKKRGYPLNAPLMSPSQAGKKGKAKSPWATRPAIY